MSGETHRREQMVLAQRPSTGSSGQCDSNQHTSVPNRLRTAGSSDLGAADICATRPQVTGGGQEALPNHAPLLGEDLPKLKHLAERAKPCWGA